MPVYKGKSIDTINTMKGGGAPVTGSQPMQQTVQHTEQFYDQIARMGLNRLPGVPTASGDSTNQSTRLDDITQQGNTGPRSKGSQDVAEAPIEHTHATGGADDSLGNPFVHAAEVAVKAAAKLAKEQLG
jgi:hypothetical protein